MKYKLRQDLKLEYLGRALYRIEALKDFNDVKKGDLGGYVEKEANLSQYNNCWVYHDAKVCDGAYICDDALVFGNALVCGNAQVFNYAKVFGNAKVFDNVRVYCNAHIYDNARVYGDANIFNYAQVIKTPKFISGLKYNITLTETHIFIGCEGHTIYHWKKNIVKIGKKHNYTDKEIKQTIELLKALLRK